MSAMIAKRTEVRKLSELACNIRKILLRNTSNSISSSHQRSRLPSRRNHLVRSAHNLSHLGGELLTSQEFKLQDQCGSFVEFSRSYSRLASANGEEQRAAHRRAVHCEVSRTRSAQPHFKSMTAPAVDYVIDRNEGPCKRTLRTQSREQRIVPTYLSLVDESGSDSSIGSQTSRRRGGRAMRPQQTQQQTAFKVDEPLKKPGHTIQFGRRDPRALAFQNQLDESRLEQSLSLFSDKKLASAARKGSLSIHPKFQLTPGRSSQKPTPPTLKHLQEARFGRTLNTLAEQKLFKITSLNPQDFSKFPIEDEQQIQARLLAKQRAERLKAREVPEAIRPLKPMQPTVVFGRRRNENQAENFNENDNASAVQQVATATAAAAAEASSSNTADPAAVSAPNNDSESIYKRFLQGEEQVEIEVDMPRFDELYYREKDSSEAKNYSQTWHDYPEANKTIPVEKTLIPPPFRKRPKNERPVTARAWGDVDEASLRF